VRLRPSPRLVRRLAAAAATLRSSVWSPVLGKVLGIAGGMLALAAIGALATARGLGNHSTVFAEPSAARTAPAPARRPPNVAAGMAPSEAAASAAPAPAPAPSEGLTADGKVILNRANAEELRRLPGVGAKRAQAIVDLRTKLGRFRRATDLLRIKGIGPKSLKRLEPFFVLDAPVPKPEPSSSAPPPAPSSAPPASTNVSVQRQSLPPAPSR
jgi:competence protein ComEA